MSNAIRRCTAALLLAAGCAVPAPAAPGRVPVLLVHGIDDDHTAMTPLQKRLTAAGWGEVQAIDLVPADGQSGIPALAQQVKQAARQLLQRTGQPRLDVVAFSMGALVSRYWLQRLGGTRQTRRFISISGPHHGTWVALTRLNTGGRQMQPHSALLRELTGQADPWGQTRVWSFFTPYDLVIVPPQSSILPGATVASFPVLLHPWMLSDERVIQATIAALIP